MSIRVEDVDNNQINSYSSSSSSSKKEAMLKRLLEQQEIYIKELERKNRELKD